MTMFPYTPYPQRPLMGPGLMPPFRPPVRQAFMPSPVLMPPVPMPWFPPLPPVPPAIPRTGAVEPPEKEPSPPPSPPKPVAPIHYDWNSQQKTMPYSVATRLIEAGQVMRATIFIDPQSFTAIPVAELEMTNGAKRQLLLPRETGPFIAMLDEYNVAYEYRNQGATGWKKVSQEMGAMAKELFVPFIMLAGAGGLAAYAMKRFQQQQTDGETVEAIRKARKDLTDYRYDFNETLKDHEPPVQQALKAFMRDEKQVVIAKGLPGIGKTHVFLALAKEIARKNDGVMVLEIRPGVGDHVRDLLREMYSGDRTLAKKAIGFLTKENGGKPVKELLLYADEVEKIPGNLMEFLINNGIGNPTTTVPGLPKLRILATCNAWPDLVNNAATMSRSAAVVITPPTPKIVAKIFVEALAEALPGKIDVEALKTLVYPILQEYDGYSPRTVTQTVVKQVANKLQEENTADPRRIVEVLTDTLSGTALNNTEVAALMTRLLIQRVMRGQQPMELPNGPENLWRALLDDAESATKGLSFLVQANGKQFKRNIQALIKQQPLDYVKDPQTFNRAITHITTELKVGRMPGLLRRDAQLQAEKELTDAYVDFLQRTVEKEKATPDTDARARRDETLGELETLIRNLQHVDRQSPAGQALAKAAVVYRDLRGVDDPTDAAFLDKRKLDAVFARTLDYDPAKHTRANDYMLVADPSYAALFMFLRQAMRYALSES